MGNPDVLQAYAHLVEIRRKAARRNGLVFGTLFFAAVGIGAWLSGGVASVGSDLPVLAMIAIIFTLSMSQFMTSEIVNKSILELIGTLQRVDADVV
jgi:hypothetical protein